MSTGDTPRVLGTLAGLDDAQLEAGVILGGRFCIVGDQRTLDSTTVITVTDLERQLGDAESQHRLELHLLPAPRNRQDEARLQRAFACKSRVQARVHAIAHAPKRLVVVSEPAHGRPLDGIRAVDSPPAGLVRRKLVAFGVELASLLAELHAANVHGVRFNREMLRVDDGNIGLDGFPHLLHPDRDLAVEAAVQADVAALIELLQALAEPDLGLELGSTTAVELRERLSALVETPRFHELSADPPFVGRSRALAELERGRAQAQIAQPTTLVVQGQRGVGKSRLLREFAAERIAADDAIVLAGAWQEHSADSRGGLLSALEQLPQALASLELDDRDDIRRRIVRATRHLGAIVTRSAPSLGAVLRNVEELPPLELGEDFSRHTAVIADLLRAIGTQKRPLVLILDNLESIDASSVAVLKILTQSRPAHHTLMIMGLRVGAGYSPDFEFSPIDLTPLSAPDLERMLVEALPGEVTDVKGLGETLWSISSGLPLAAWTNLREWIDRGRLVRNIDDGVWRTRGRLRDDGSRPGVHDVFGARLAAASPTVRLLALRLAVLGVEVGPSELALLRQVSETEFDAAVADLVARGILTHTAKGVRFPHDSIREFVLEAFDEQQRRDAHTHAAELLTRQKAPVAQIAYHRDLGLDPQAGSEQFDRLSRIHVEAGRERLAIYDLERARWHLERALDHSRDPDQRSIAAEGLADICLLLDDVDTAVSLYTAIIATGEPGHAVATAAKAVSFLFSKYANTEARQLAAMALEVVSEPIPTSPFGKLAVLFGSIFRSWFSSPKSDVVVRDALCRLYSWLTIMNIADDPIAMLMFTARGHWVSKGLETAAASMVRAVEASVWAALRQYDRSSNIFAVAQRIAEKVNDSWSRGWTYHNWAHVNLLPSDRYEEGQDMLDDGIAAFRDTGDVSISIISIMFKCLYGRDRESADTVLGWYDEAVSMARRNGKAVATVSLEAIKLLVLARQNRSDLDEHYIKLIGQLDREDMTPIDRLIARVYLAYAAYESKSWSIAVEQVHIAQGELGDLPGIPDYCSEIHLVTALTMLERPTATAKDRKLLRQSIRKFHRAAKQSPRLRSLAGLMDAELALHTHDRSKAQAIASQVVAEFDQHQNLYAARQAHLVLSRVLRGENVLAAAEHDRVARNLGRRLGLQERALLSEFSDVEEEIGMIDLSGEATLKLHESQHDIPAAGMLGATAVQIPSKRRRPTLHPLESQADVLEAWALTSTATQHTILGEVLTPVRDAIGVAADGAPLEIHCATPNLEVPVASGDLQLVLVNLILACRDAVSPEAVITLRLEHEVVGEDTLRTRLGDDGTPTRVSALRPGPYLTIRVTAPSPTNRVPILASFSTCERLVQSIGGHLEANTGRTQIAMTVRIPLDAARMSAKVTRVVIVHGQADVRVALAEALNQLGVYAHVHDPIDFDAAALEKSSVVFVDAQALDSLAILEPVLGLRLIEVVKRGETSVAPHHLTFPFSVSELDHELNK